MTQEKRTLSDLAINGGVSLFSREKTENSAVDSEKLSFFVNKIYERGIFTNDGPIVRDLESKLEKVHGCRFCIVTSNASIALVLTLSAFKSCKGDEVIIPEIYYASFLDIVQWAGLKPIIAKCCPSRGVIETSELNRLTTSKTVAVLAINHATHLCALDDLESYSDAAGIPVILDSVRAFGMTHNSRVLGTFATAEVFSLSSEKVVQGAQGGYVSTNSEKLYFQLKSLRNFGFEGLHRHSDNFGLNAKLNEFHAARALIGLDRVQSQINHYQALTVLFIKSNCHFNHMRFLAPDIHINSPCDHVFLILKTPGGTDAQSKLARVLTSENIKLGKHYLKHYPSGCYWPEYSVNISVKHINDEESALKLIKLVQFIDKNFEQILLNKTSATKSIS